MLRLLALVLLAGGVAPAASAPVAPLEQLAERLRDQTLPFVEPQDAIGVRLHDASSHPTNNPATPDLLALLLSRLQDAGLHAQEAHEDTRAFDRLLDVEATSDGVTLTATARLYELAGPPWPIPPRLQHLLYATVALRSAPSSPAAVSRGPLALRRRALALDGDIEDVRALAVTWSRPRQEPLVVLVGKEVAAYSVTADGGAVSRWHAPLTGPLAASWPRTPLASLTIDDATVVVRTSEHARAERRRLTNGALDDRPAPEATVGLGRCALEPGVDWFVAHGCGDGQWPARFYAPTVRVPSGDGHPLRAAIALDPEPTLWLAREGEALRVPRVGAQVALAQLTDGWVVATTQPVARGRDDELVVRALDGTIRFASGPLPGSIEALASGDSDGDGNDELWAAVCRGACQLYVWQ